jgi:hypothetical protein
MVILMLPFAMPGYFGQAESLVECLGAMVDGEHVQDEVLAFLPGLGGERADEPAADAESLVAGRTSMRAR